MKEILELKNCLINHQYESVITIVKELELMGRQDKVNNLESFLMILLIRLIKIQVEKRVTRSWQSSILNSLREIQKRNRLGKKSQYIKSNQWDKHFDAIVPDDIFKAADEAFGGIEIKELRSLANLYSLQKTTFELLKLTYTLDRDSLVQLIYD